jgi:uncharacterized membrane protein YoaT (DUF817 family)
MHLLTQLWYFGLKQAYACLFGGALLFLIVATKLFWPDDAALARYDFLLLMALLIQAVFIALKLESLEEVKVIFLFHLVGTVMEIFKTHVGSWSYPEDNFFRIGGVPLFSGFMYSAVGSYIARVSRILDMRYTDYPPMVWTGILCVLIYVNFFTHHYTYDIRYLLFALTFWLYRNTWVYYRPHKMNYRMPLLLGFVLVAFFIWIAENVGTFGAIWYYPTQQDGWHPVSLSKMGSWFLLMIISFVLVSFIHKPEVPREQ